QRIMYDKAEREGPMRTLELRAEDQRGELELLAAKSQKQKDQNPTQDMQGDKNQSNDLPQEGGVGSVRQQWGIDNTRNDGAGGGGPDAWRKNPDGTRRLHKARDFRTTPGEDITSLIDGYVIRTVEQASNKGGDLKGTVLLTEDKNIFLRFSMQSQKNNIRYLL
ncbi:MAG: hypothetical protein AAF442_04305, partial [Pseudomonadota bacterium]